MEGYTSLILYDEVGGGANICSIEVTGKLHKFLQKNNSCKKFFSTIFVYCIGPTQLFYEWLAQKMYHRAVCQLSNLYEMKSFKNAAKFS